jgi:hypothetical protein
VEPVTILAISSSPRRGGNTDRLLSEAMKASLSFGARVETANLCDYDMQPCIECGQCEGVGQCVIQDDFQRLYKSFMAVDRVILASPVFFMTVSSQAKVLIDRCQCFWERKYRMKLRIPARGGIPRRGYLISCAGSGLPDVFDCSRKVVDFFYRTLDMEFAGDVALNGVNDVGDAEKHPESLKAAFELGMKAASPE